MQNVYPADEMPTEQHLQLEGGYIRKIARYEVIELVGRGAYGRVYSCHDPVLNRQVAVKVVTPDAPEDVKEELLHRFQMEAQMLGQLSHPNVVAVYDAGLYQGSPFLVMELCSGPNLEELLRERRQTDIATARTVLQQMSGALGYVHSRHIIHRDIKPANLMYHGDVLKLTDFGIAFSEAMSRMTATGKVIGTPFFMSPEQARGETLDHRSDLFSMALLIYTLLCGRPPFLGEPLQVMTQLISKIAPPITRFAPELPKSLDGFFERALKMEAEERFSSAEEMNAAFAALVSPSGASPDAGAVSWSTDPERSAPTSASSSAPGMDPADPLAQLLSPVKVDSIDAFGTPSLRADAVGGIPDVPQLDLEPPPLELSMDPPSLSSPAVEPPVSLPSQSLADDSSPADLPHAAPWEGEPKLMSALANMSDEQIAAVLKTATETVTNATAPTNPHPMANSTRNIFLLGLVMALVALMYAAGGDLGEWGASTTEQLSVLMALSQPIENHGAGALTAGTQEKPAVKVSDAVDRSSSREKTRPGTARSSAVRTPMVRKKSQASAKKQPVTRSKGSRGVATTRREKGRKQQLASRRSTAQVLRDSAAHQAAINARGIHSMAGPSESTGSQLVSRPSERIENVRVGGIPLFIAPKPYNPGAENAVPAQAAAPKTQRIRGDLSAKRSWKPKSGNGIRLVHPMTAQAGDLVSVTAHIYSLPSNATVEGMWRMGGSEWTRAFTQNLGDNRFALEVVPPAGRLQFKFEVRSEKGKILIRASQTLEVERAPETPGNGPRS